MNFKPTILKTVYFVRHGQSEHNVAPVFQSPDSPLSQKGRDQANNIAERVSKLDFQALISSPMERAKQTAQIISKVTGKTIEYNELFVERTKPSYINGKPYTDEKADRLWREWEESLYASGLRSEDGENYEDLMVRSAKAIDFLSNRPEQNIVVVTHGFFLRVMLAKVLMGDLLSGEALRRFQTAARMENTGITVLRYENGFEEEPAWRLWIYNDHAHLG